MFCGGVLNFHRSGEVGLLGRTLFSRFLWAGLRGWGNSRSLTAQRYLVWRGVLLDMVDHQHGHGALLLLQLKAHFLVYGIEDGDAVSSRAIQRSARSPLDVEVVVPIEPGGIDDRLGEIAARPVVQILCEPLANDRMPGSYSFMNRSRIGYRCRRDRRRYVGSSDGILSAVGGRWGWGLGAIPHPSKVRMRHSNCGGSGIRGSCRPIPGPRRRGISTPQTKTCLWGPRTGGTR